MTSKRDPGVLFMWEKTYKNILKHNHLTGLRNINEPAILGTCWVPDGYQGFDP
jgi:hypothetical protein